MPGPFGSAMPTARLIRSEYSIESSACSRNDHMLHAEFEMLHNKFLRLRVGIAFAVAKGIPEAVDAVKVERD